MRTVSLSEAKATFSEQLRHVREGKEVLITLRGKPVAKIVPVHGPPPSRAIDGLVAAGLVRRGPGGLPLNFWDLDRPRDPEASVRTAVYEERESNR